MGSTQHCGRWLKKLIKFACLVFLLICIGIFQNHEETTENDSSGLNCDVHAPVEHEIVTDKDVWQVLQVSKKKKLKFFNAYLDTRQNPAVVRINSYGPKHFIENPELYCRFWYEDERVYSSEVIKASGVQSMVPSW